MGVFRGIPVSPTGVPGYSVGVPEYNSVYYLARLEILLRPVFFNTERFFQ